MRLPAIRHRLLLSLRDAPEPTTVRELAPRIGRSIAQTHFHLMRLREAGLLEPAVDKCHRSGFRLRDGVVVGNQGYVGRVTRLDLDLARQHEEIAACG